MWIFLGRIIVFFQIKGDFKINDKVTWDLSQEEGIVLSEEFGEGPFRVAAFKEKNGDVLLSDSGGMILSDHHYRPLEIKKGLLKFT
jgi:hypothetical protein